MFRHDRPKRPNARYRGRQLASCALCWRPTAGDQSGLAAAKALPRATSEPHTVLLTGANGYLGRFVTLEWLQRLSRTGGKLITIVRGSDADAARARLEKVFDSGDPHLLRRFRALAAEHLEVIAGDIGEPKLGVDRTTWERLARTTDS
jgi:fatty acid CoA ligase FadD9